MAPMRLFSPRRGGSRRAWLTSALLGVAALGCLGVGSVLAVGWWMDYSDEPEMCDVLVVLAGDYARPFHGADLYLKGFAPGVWLVRPYRPIPEALVDQAGIPLPREEDVNREILLRKGVPADKIHLYGDGAVSTVTEARMLGSSVDVRGKKILVVTSRWHARRAARIFRDVLKGAASVKVVGTPYEPFTRRWWTQRDLAVPAVLETAKTVFYLLGQGYLPQPLLPAEQQRAQGLRARRPGGA